MRSIELPSVFHRFSQIGGALKFASFEVTQGDQETALAAICAAIPGADKDKLRILGCRRIDDALFLGDWYDTETKSLLKLGHYTMKDGQTLKDPRLRDLEGKQLSHGSGQCVEVGCGGQFAYAFSKPPYSLSASPTEVQELFDVIHEFVNPPSFEHEILDWTNPQLDEVADYFTDGMEWWGVFLFTIFVPALSRLTVISGSTTD